MSIPDLHELLKTNIPPNNTQRCYVQELVRQEEKQFQHLAVQVEELTRCRNEVYDRLYGYKSVVSAARRFPPEIVTMVFRESMELAFSDDRRDDLDAIWSYAPTLSSNGVPGVLAHICSGWREVALNTADIWTSVEVLLEDDGAPPSAFEKQLELAKLWIGRCQSLPFDLSVHTPARQPRPSTSHLPHALKTLLMINPHSIQQLYLTIHDRHLPTFSSLPVDAFAGLCYLRIQLRSLQRFLQQNDLSLLGSPADTPALAHAPKLEGIDLQFHGETPVGLDLLPFPWAQLRSVRLMSESRGKVDPTSFRTMLAQAPLLEECRVALLEDFDFGPTSVIAARLKLLAVHMPSVGLIEVFHRLQLPALEDFSLFFDRYRVPLDRLFQLLEESKFKLLGLRLTEGVFNRADLLRWLGEIPTLETVDLKFCICVNPEFLSAFECTAGNDTAGTAVAAATPFLPNLIELGLYLVGTPEDNIRALASMIRTRGYPDAQEGSNGVVDGQSTRVAKLRVLSLCSKIGTEAKEKLKVFAAQGLLIRIVDPPTVSMW